jgi:hypothetical protein
LAHGFRGVSPYLVTAILGPVAGRNIMVETWWRRAAHLMVAGNKNREERARVTMSPSRAQLQGPNFLPLGPTS